LFLTTGLLITHMILQVPIVQDICVQEITNYMLSTSVEMFTPLDEAAGRVIEQPQKRFAGEQMKSESGWPTQQYDCADAD